MAIGRWFSLQASEFIKPFFAVVAAWMFSEWRSRTSFLVISYLIDFYNNCKLSAWSARSWPNHCYLSRVVMPIFLAGLSLFFVISFFIFGIIGLVVAYFFDHVRSRVDRFLDPSTGDTYQIDRS